ncbi:MAG: TIGR03560 family F420-dependent LLM class oxidoreductase [Chloroflexota bacterium]|nr:TIGR03560 family F420-dependent LLM class oxidoreductase [Chloroflexota bacterium]
MRPLRFGFKTSQQHTTYEEIAKVWEAADKIPVFEHGWLFDHFNPIGQESVEGPCLEGWTVLGALAARTERVRLGLMTTGNTYRHPAIHAHIAATADIVSGGRVDFGMGAGWNVYEHESMGLPLYQPGERIRRLGEAAELTKLLWTRDVVDYDGRYYQLKQARLDPKPVQRPHPPIVIGGGGEQLTLRVVARHADIWNFGGGEVETFTHKVAILREHCAAVGRDPDEIELSAQIRVKFDDLDGSAREVQALADAGASHLILILPPPYRVDQITRLAAELIPQIESPTPA